MIYNLSLIYSLMGLNQTIMNFDDSISILKTEIIIEIDGFNLVSK